MNFEKKKCDDLTELFMLYLLFCSKKKKHFQQVKSCCEKENGGALRQGLIGHPKQIARILRTTVVIQKMHMHSLGPFLEGRNKASVLHVLILGLRGKQTLFPDQNSDH